jgi:hypothetical protein
MPDPLRVELEKKMSPGADFDAVLRRCVLLEAVVGQRAERLGFQGGRDCAAKYVQRRSHCGERLTARPFLAPTLSGRRFSS